MITTPFEDSNYTTWTTQDQERTFLASVIASSSRVTTEQIGASASGRPVDLVTVKIGEPTGRPFFISGLPHGNEPSGREATLALIRDLSETNDTDLVAYMGEHPLLVVPTNNPDGLSGNKRNNDQGVNLNRDWLAASQPEIEACVKVLRDYRPSVAIDLHEVPEGFSDPDGFQSWETESGMDIDLDDDIYTEAISAVTGQLFPAFDAASVPRAWFRSRYTSGGTMHQSVSTRGTFAFLSEAIAVGDNGGTRLQRFNWCRLALDTLIEWHRTADPDATTAQARLRTAAKGIAPRPWAISGHRSNPRHNSQSGSSITAVGYRLSAAQHATAAPCLEAHGIRTYATGESDRWVPLAQPLAPITVKVLDPSSSERVVDSATRPTEPPPFTGPDVWSDAVAL